MIVVQHILFAIPMMAKSMFFFFNSNKNTATINNFVSLLDEEQKKFMLILLKKRLHLFVTGAVLGLVLAVFYILLVKRDYNLVSLSNICDLIVIQGLVTCMYYTVTPNQLI